ncbi:pre-mRNA-splicing factor Prp9p [Trichomonascus vanleenenianus]|uniref:SF3a splicing factor complex subunit PRP9 n=1 Tax=Trichomonascus vanleenenianus TaxID=2268995 RepID=UPI003EC9BBAA
MLAKDIDQLKESHRRTQFEQMTNMADMYCMLRSSKATEEYSGANQLLSPATTDVVNIETMFTDEERYGQFVDLIEHHERFVNLKYVERKLTYVQYLERFFDFDDKDLFPTVRLQNNDYFAYTKALSEYLTKFLTKIGPLEPIGAFLASIESDFSRNWQNGTISWYHESHEPDGKPAEDGSVWCTACAKTFAKESIYKSHLNGKKHKKNSALVDGEAKSTGGDLAQRIIISHEFSIKQLVDRLSKQISDTKGNIERKQALTDRERQLEIEAFEEERSAPYGPEDNSKEDNEEGSSDEEDEESYVSNPLNMPLGFDGKPIPYWLWKLNGLRVEYSCEICGNYTYMGRKAFEKHFTEPRHAKGLRCLGIQPDPVYKNVTSIAEARKLAEKFRRDRRKKESQLENTVEMEDEEGNVMSQKVYNDLKKQGLL